MAPRKTVLLTVGTIEPFPELINVCITPTFLSKLASLGFTHLFIQHALSATNISVTPDSQTVLNRVNDLVNSTTCPLKVNAYLFVANLSREIAKSDLVISHVGTGSILDSLRYVKRLVVVPNANASDNPQIGLARELDRQGYLVEGKVEYDYF